MFVFWMLCLYMIFVAVETNRPQGMLNLVSNRRVWKTHHITLLDVRWMLCHGFGLETNVAASEWHYDVMKWKHFPRYWPFVRGIHRSPVNSPHKGRWRGALMFSLLCVWINGWVINREAGDMRRRCAHYDVIVMGGGDGKDCDGLVRPSVTHPASYASVKTSNMVYAFIMGFPWFDKRLAILCWIPFGWFIHGDVMTWKRRLHHWPLVRESRV